MNAHGPLISRMSIFILSYFLVQTGFAQRLSHPAAANCILVGCVGFIAYASAELSHLLQNGRVVANA